MSVAAGTQEEAAMFRVWMVLSALALGGQAAAAQEATPGAPEVIDIVLRDVDGQVVGTATFAQALDDQVSIHVSVEGLTSGEHGIHVHETGVCDSAGNTPFASAGGHYNPTGATHGHPPRQANTRGHAGDLGNLRVVGGDAGGGELRIENVRFLRLAELNDADGSALVIHANPDDLRTDPSGNSGGRVVCGVIAAPQGGATPLATPGA